MKILITTDLYTPSINGVVTSVISLKNELIKRGHDVRILTLKQRGKFNQEKNTWYVRSISAGKIYPQARILCSFGKKQKREIAAWGPDIIHSQCEFSTFVLARKISKELKIPIVHTYHTVYEDYTHYFIPSDKIGRVLARKVSSSILSHTQAVIAPTEKIWRILKRYGVGEPLYTLASGIDLEMAAKKTSRSRLEELKSKYGIESGKKILLFLGRMAKEKNVMELIDYFKKLENEDFVLLLVGDGPQRSQLEETVIKLGLENRIIFTGMVPRKSVNEHYQLADVFVCASTSETQGLTYIEALSNGIPALCRKDECIQDVIFNGRNGFQYTSYEEFEGNLEYIFSKKSIYEEMSKEALAVAKNFSVKVTAKKIEIIYEKTIFENKKDFEIEVA